MEAVRLMLRAWRKVKRLMGVVDAHAGETHRCDLGIEMRKRGNLRVSRNQRRTSPQMREGGHVGRRGALRSRYVLDSRDL
jgi:hypothetical protein